jgi:hypothetical protein
MMEVMTDLSDNEVGKAGPRRVCPNQPVSRHSGGRWFTAVAPVLLLLVVAFWAGGSALPVQADTTFNTLFSVDEPEAGGEPEAALAVPASATQALPKTTLDPGGASAAAPVSRPGEDHRIRAPPR